MCSGQCRRNRHTEMWLPLATWCLANSRAPHRGTFVSINRFFQIAIQCFRKIFNMIFAVFKFHVNNRYRVRFDLSFIGFRECSSVGSSHTFMHIGIGIGYKYTHLYMYAYIYLLGLLLLLMILVFYMVRQYWFFFFLVLALRVYHIHIYRFLSVSVYSVFGCVCVFYLVYFSLFFGFRFRYHFCNWWIQK